MRLLLIPLAGMLFTAATWAGDPQVPPLDPNDYDECTIQDPGPLLDGAAYAGQGYKLTTLKKKPLTLLEETKLPNGLSLRVEQRGCADEVLDLKFTGKETAAEILPKAAASLSALRLSKKPFFSAASLARLQAALEKKLKSVKGPADAFGSVLCLMRVEPECITDVAISKAGSHGVRLYYVDRP